MYIEKFIIQKCNYTTDRQTKGLPVSLLVKLQLRHSTDEYDTMPSAAVEAGVATTGIEFHVQRPAIVYHLGG